MKTSTPTGSIVAFTLALLVAQSAYAFYNPQLGRWATRDPIEEEGGFNLYAVAFNDLVNSRDAFGLQGKGGKPATRTTTVEPGRLEGRARELLRLRVRSSGQANSTRLNGRCTTRIPTPIHLR